MAEEEGVISDIIELDENAENENLLAEDQAEYSRKSDFSKAEVVKLQFNRCSELGSKEMREGYFNYDKLGNRIRVPDSRKEFVYAVKMLTQILLPEIKREKMDEKSLRDKEKALIQKWGVYPFKIENGTLVQVTDDKLKFIPFLDQSFPKRHLKKVGARVIGSMEQTKGIYNDNHNGYWDDMVVLYQEWFGELSILIDKCNYFKQQIQF